jgi:non-ribosomal peptide synthetase component E (peptide arylation enzyme)
MFDYAAEERFAVLGTSAKFIDAVRKAGLEPAKTHDLSSLRLLTSTGSPLSPEGFSYVYEGIKPDVHLASISGGTDIVSCFVLGNPALPVWRGEIQGPGLGMAVEVWDDNGKPVTGEKGELVCTKPFPAMPIGFWNDTDGEKYHAAYFSRFDNIWTHGDFAEWTPHHGIIIHGRSDATLNPGGVRIGTAEIYNQVEQMDEVWRRSASARTGTTMSASSCSSALPKAWRSTTISRRESAPRSAPVPRPVTCRQRSSPSPTSRAPSPARSLSLLSAMWFTAGRSRTRKRSPIRKRWTCLPGWKS